MRPSAPRAGNSLSHHSEDAEACYRAGIAQQAEGQVERARASYERAVALDPRHARAHNNLGSLLHLRGDRAAAIGCYQRALEACADLPDPHRNLAIAYIEAADYANAARHARRAVELAPASAELNALLAEALRGAGKADEALAAGREATRLDARSARAWNATGLALKELGRAGDAREAFSRALSLEDGFAEAHLNLGLALQDERDFDGARACFETAIERDPALAEAHLAMGVLLEVAWDSPAAMDSYRRAIALKPDLAQARFNHALQLLHSGDFGRGWQEYEWRWRLPELAGMLPRVQAPPWDGSPLSGKAILLYAEQGLGDAIQFVRYAPLVAGTGARVVVRCPAPLAGLFRAVAGVAAVVGEGDPEPSCDFSAPLLSLPRLLYAAHPAIPAEVPYLRPDADAVARLRAAMQIGDGRALRVGLVWASHSARPSLGALKSFTLEALAPLAAARAGVRFYSLQTGPSAVQARSGPAGMALLDLSAQLHDFSETAAAIANLDLVISADTAVAHLAGAMGKPVWTLVAFPPDWRWRRRGDRCDWYPSMRLFRQRRSYEWGEVVQEAARALAGYAADGRGVPAS